MKDIVFLMYQFEFGGIERCLLNIIDGLHNKYKIHVIVRKPIHHKFFIDYFKDKNISVYNINTLKAKHVLRKTNLIVDYFNTSFCNEIKGYNVPKIGFLHIGSQTYLKYRECETDYLFTVYNKLICLTEDFHRIISKKFPKYKDSLVCIYNPVNIKRIQDMANEFVVKDKNYFTFVGRLADDKDHITVFNAFKLLVKKHKNIKLYCVGDGPRKEEYIKYIEQLKLTKNVVFTGAVTNPYPYIKGALGNILSSPSEGLPTVILESIVLNTLNIASDCHDGPSELLQDGKAGLLFPVGDEQNLFKLLDKVCSSKTKNKSLITKSQTVLNSVKQEKVISIYDKLFSDVINETPKFIPEYFSHTDYLFLKKILLLRKKMAVKKIKYNLFGLIPLYTVKINGNEKIYCLFGCIKILRTKTY